ncbi:MAG: hypothetical protein AAFY11_00140 [Cyanobacteria bacterium J06641_5]
MPLNFDPVDLVAAPAVEVSLIMPTEYDPNHYLKIYFSTVPAKAIVQELEPLTQMAPEVLRLPRSRDLESRDGLFYQIAPTCNAGTVASEVARCLREDCHLGVRCYSANAQQRWPQASPWPSNGNPEPPTRESATPESSSALLAALDRLTNRLEAVELCLECQRLTPLELARRLLTELQQDPWPEAEIQHTTALIEVYPPATAAEAQAIAALRSLVATAGEALVPELTSFLQAREPENAL